MSHALEGFFQQGTPRTDIIKGNQYETDCIFCLKERKFYINIEKKLWDCKVCGEKGNYLNFLEKVCKLNESLIKPEHFEILAVDRNLPVEAFQGYGIGWDGKKFTIPLYDYNNEFKGVRCFRPGFKTMSVKDTQVQLFCANRLNNNFPDTVYIAEGEWDAIALTWLLKKLQKPGFVVGTPGAQTFKDEWSSYFYQKEVVVCYDNDKAGEDGELKIHTILQNIAKNISYIHWPEGKPDGYDLRDLIGSKAYNHKKPKTCFKNILGWLQEVPRNLLSQAIPDKRGKYILNPDRRKRFPKKTFEEVIQAFQNYLYMKDITPIKVMLATVFANRIDGEMIWMFLVAPPSSAKTELIRSLFMLQNIVPVSSLTQNTLLSGFLAPGKADMSLLKQLDGKIMAIKDFTAVLTMMQVKRDEIFGQLRDAYDGESSKFFGHGQHAVTKAKFGLISGVTGAIEKFGQVHQTLGERFLRYYIPKDTSEDEVMMKLKRAMENTGKHTELRRVLAETVAGYFEHQAVMRPIVPEAIATKIMYLARFTALMRGFVDKDQHNHVLYKPDAEAPIRLCKQLFQMAIGLACLESREEVNEEDYEIVRQIAIGTCPSRVEAVVKVMFEENGLPLRVQEIALKIGYEIQTTNFILKDLVALHLLNRDGAGRGLYYSVSESTKRIIEKGKIYPPQAAPSPEKKKLTFVLKK